MLQITGQSIQNTSTMKMINRKKVKGHHRRKWLSLTRFLCNYFKILLQMLYKKIKSVLLLIVIYLHHVMLYIVSSQLLRPESHNTVMGSHAWFWPKRLQRRLCNIGINILGYNQLRCFYRISYSFLLCLVNWDFSCFIGREESISTHLKRSHYIEFSSVLPVIHGLNLIVPCSHCNLFLTVWRMGEYLKKLLTRNS